MDYTNLINEKNIDEDNIESFLEVVPYEDNISEMSCEFLSDDSESEKVDARNCKQPSKVDNKSYPTINVLSSKINKTVIKASRTPVKNKKIWGDFSSEIELKRCRGKKNTRKSFPKATLNISKSSTSLDNKLCTSLPLNVTQFISPNRSPLKFKSNRLSKTKNYCTNLSVVDDFAKEGQNDPCPIYLDHQLIGDSQLLRFAEQILKMKNDVSYLGARRIGYCVSGQTINDLEKRLLRGKYKIHDKVIVLIGTNDLMKNTMLRAMCESFDTVVNTLQKSANRIVLLTVPPIPRFVSNQKHWSSLDIFNKYIISKADEQRIFAIDLGNHFIGYDNTTINTYYERTFFDGRPDMLHLNKKGFKLLQAILNINYFDEIGNFQHV